MGFQFECVSFKRNGHIFSPFLYVHWPYHVYFVFLVIVFRAIKQQRTEYSQEVALESWPGQVQQCLAAFSSAASFLASTPYGLAIASTEDPSTPWCQPRAIGFQSKNSTRQKLIKIYQYQYHGLFHFYLYSSLKIRWTYWACRYKLYAIFLQKILVMQQGTRVHAT